ncbi:hypothetical protein [Campylobacter curvus]|jgi:hypothetical protein|uniref:hypothetical protein n=1 Tax=Campylobacter curvus TaxID=200 RepID=UPI0014707256|nr:hypothetical protein [Campylobacter curvus]
MTKTYDEVEIELWEKIVQAVKDNDHTLLKITSSQLDMLLALKSLFKIKEKRRYKGVIKASKNRGPVVHIDPKIETTLVEDIHSEKLKSKVVFKELSNPFKKINNKGYDWTTFDENLIAYCGAGTSPQSHREFSYLKLKLPKDLSDGAIRSKLKRMGYRIKKGLICKI